MKVFNNTDEPIVVGRTTIPPRSSESVDDAYLITPWAKKMKKERRIVFPYYGHLPWEQANVVKTVEVRAPIEAVKSLDELEEKPADKPVVEE